MAYTFKKVMNNVNIGSSLFDDEGAKIVADIISTANAKNIQIHLPFDHVAAVNLLQMLNLKLLVMMMVYQKIGWG